jgi:hypothetical protein
LKANSYFGQPILRYAISFLLPKRRTNIPKQLMEIEGFPLDDYPSFPDHRQIMQYLNNVVDQCGIRKYIQVFISPGLSKFPFIYPQLFVGELMSYLCHLWVLFCALWRPARLDYVSNMAGVL